MPYSALIGIPSQTPGVSPVLADDWNDYVKDNFELLRYGHLVFADAAARNAGVSDSPTGMMVYLVDSGALSVLGASGWREAVNTASIEALAVTTAKIAALAVTTAKIDDNAVTEAKIASNAVTQAKMADNSVGTAEIVDANVTYAKLAADVKTFDVPTSGTGVYFTSSGDFTAASLSTASAQNPVVVSAASSAVTLSLPNNIGSEGATITVCQTGTGTVTISPKSGSAATINGSTSNTYTLGAQYSVVTLLCLSNSGSNGAWVIIGDYI